MAPERPRPTTDVSAAEWLQEEMTRFAQLVPEGYEAVCRIAHPDREGDPPPELLAALVEVLGRHTETGDRCWFCLWEGWGWIGGDASVVMLASEGFGAEALRLSPAFAEEIIGGPRVRLPGRDYLLFEGPLDSALELGRRPEELLAASSPETPGIDLRFTPQPPNIFWPEDRAWVVASEIDLDWTEVAGPVALIEELVSAGLAVRT